MSAGVYIKKDFINYTVIEIDDIGNETMLAGPCSTLEIAMHHAVQQLVHGACYIRLDKPASSTSALEKELLR